VQALRATSLKPAVEQALVRHLARSLAPALSYRKSGHPTNAVSRLSQRIKGLAQSKPQGTHHTRGDNRNTGTDIYSVSIGSFQHFQMKKLIVFLIAFLKEAFY
jgi:hypothetical protein